MKREEKYLNDYFYLRFSVLLWATKFDPLRYLGKNKVTRTKPNMLHENIDIYAGKKMPAERTRELNVAKAALTNADHKN